MLFLRVAWFPLVVTLLALGLASLGGHHPRFFACRDVVVGVWAVALAFWAVFGSYGGRWRWIVLTLLFGSIVWITRGLDETHTCASLFTLYLSYQIPAMLLLRVIGYRLEAPATINHRIQFVADLVAAQTPTMDQPPIERMQHTVYDLIALMTAVAVACSAEATLPDMLGKEYAGLELALFRTVEALMSAIWAWALLSEHRRLARVSVILGGGIVSAMCEGFSFAAMLLPVYWIVIGGLLLVLLFGIWMAPIFGSLRYWGYRLTGTYYSEKVE